MQTVSLKRHIAVMDKITALSNVRERSRKETRERLARSGFSEEEIQDGIDTALRVGLISDERYARSFIRGKVHAGWGREERRSAGSRSAGWIPPSSRPVKTSSPRPKRSTSARFTSLRNAPVTPQTPTSPTCAVSSARGTRMRCPDARCMTTCRVPAATRERHIRQ